MGKKNFFFVSGDFPGVFFSLKMEFTFFLQTPNKMKRKVPVPEDPDCAQEPSKCGKRTQIEPTMKGEDVKIQMLKEKYQDSKRLQHELITLCHEIHGGKKEGYGQDVEIMIVQIDTYSGDRRMVSRMELDAEYSENGKRKYVPSKPILRIYGMTMKGISVLIHVHDFQPYFFVQVRENFNSKDVEVFKYHLNQALKIRLARKAKTYIADIEILKDRNSIYGYHLPTHTATFLKVTMLQPMYVGVARKILETGLLSANLNVLETYQTFESNVLFILRFMVDLNLSSGTWIRIPFEKCFSEGIHTSTCNMELDVTYTDIIPLGCDQEWSQIPPLRILSMDIEAQGQKGHFPDPRTDPCIQIASIFQLSNGSENKIGTSVYVIHALRTCEPLTSQNLPDYYDEKNPPPFLISHETEAEMLLNWSDMMRALDPDILVGYNICDFDYPFLIERARVLGIQDRFIIGRIESLQCEAKSRTKDSQQQGKRQVCDVTVPGRVMFDILPLVRSEQVKLRSYTLNNVAFHYLGLTKEDVHHTQIPKLQDGSDSNRTRLAIYCLKDAMLPLRLMDKLMFLINTIEMTRVTGITLTLLMQRGQQMKVFSKLLRKSQQVKMLLPTLEHKGQEEFKGADVITPLSGYYTDPVTVLDFNSLYPTIMIAHNLCYLTWIKDPSRFSADFLASSCTITPVKQYFVKPEVKSGLLPSILKEILQARSQAKTLMEDEKDPFKKAVYNGRQLALKVTANSVYGFTGADFGLLPCYPISSSVTGFGRDMLLTSKKFIEEKYTIANGQEYDAKVVYGDTDSVFVKFGYSDLETCLRLGTEAAKLVTQLFVPPIKLEREKAYYPLLLHKKKKYAGLHWENSQKPKRVDYKGLEVVRRETCKLVPEVIDQVMKTLFYRGQFTHQEALKKAVTMVENTIRDLYMDKIDMSMLIMRLGLGKDPKDYKGNVSHVRLAQRMYKRDPTTAPKMGDVVWFVFTGRSTTENKMKRSNVIEDPLYVLKHKIPLCPQAYVEKQLCKPLSRIFQHLLKPQELQELWTGKHTRFRTPPHSKAMGSNYGILKFMVRNRVCQSCQVVLNKTETKGLCRKCEEFRIPFTLKHTEEEKKYQIICDTLHQQCIRCQDGTPYEKIDCQNLDCPIFFKRTKMDEHLLQSSARLKELF